MKKHRIINERYPHHIKIVRTLAYDSPFEECDEERVLYFGPGRGYTDTTTTGDKKMDSMRRKCSIPVRFDKWQMPILDGDAITVVYGNYSEDGVVKDFECDNDRTIIYWEYGRV